MNEINSCRIPRITGQAGQRDQISLGGNVGFGTCAQQCSSLGFPCWADHEVRARLDMGTNPQMQLAFDWTTGLSKTRRRLLLSRLDWPPPPRLRRHSKHRPLLIPLPSSRA